MAKGGDTKLKKLFKGKDSYGEEVKEAKAIKSGKITPKEYAQGEEMEKKMKKGGKVQVQRPAGLAELALSKALLSVVIYVAPPIVKTPVPSDVPINIVLEAYE